LPLQHAIARLKAQKFCSTILNIHPSNFLLKKCLQALPQLFLSNNKILNDKMLNNLMSNNKMLKDKMLNDNMPKDKMLNDKLWNEKMSTCMYINVELLSM
jgi:pentapeptide MXKDX repeat protein